MKTRLILATAALISAPYMMAPAALALEYPKQAYDATYEIVNPQGKSEMRMASDGKGLTLMKTENAGQKMRVIGDFKNGVSTTLMDTAKMAIKSKMMESAAGNYDESAFKKKGAKSLGAKVVNGRPCHGWEYTEAGSKSTTWVGDDCKIMVQSITETPKVGTTTMNLKKFAGAPAASEFKAQIPSDYKIMGQ